MSRVQLFRFVILLLSAGVTSTVWAAGSGTLVGAEKFKVSKCGSFTAGGNAVIAIAANGAFSANVGGNLYTGTATTVGRNITFVLDANSLALFSAVLADEASDLCEESVTVNSLTVTKATLKLNKTQTAAKLQFAATGAGSAASGTGTGKYSLKGAGSWTAQ
jgi:hypothetical protein